MKLRSYQRQILDELAHLPSIGLFMKTGTGKTYTAIVRFLEQPETPNLLVLCPSKVVSQWRSVITNDFNLGHRIINPPNKLSAVELDNYIVSKLPRDEPSIIIVSLESVARMPNFGSVIDESFCIIVDESHKIKEFGTKRSPVKVTHAVLALGTHTFYKMILSATPTQKQYGGYIDYYTQLTFLGYLKVPYNVFKDYYCVIKKIQVVGMPFPIDKIIGYKHKKELDDLLKLCCRSYTPKIGEFEPQHNLITLEKPHSYNKLLKERAYQNLDLTNISSYRMAKKTLTSGLISGHDRYGAPLKFKDNTVKIDWLKEFLSNTDETVVIFYKYNVELELLELMCKELELHYIVINGANKHKYESIVKGGYKVVLGQYAACGESVDGLQHQSHICIYYCMPESSLEHRQALGRIDRIGQTLVPMYYYLVVEDTIDALIYKMTQEKIEYTTEVLDSMSIDI